MTIKMSGNVFEGNGVNVVGPGSFEVIGCKINGKAVAIKVADDGSVQVAGITPTSGARVTIGAVTAVAIDGKWTLEQA